MYKLVTVVRNAQVTYRNASTDVQVCAAERMLIKKRKNMHEKTRSFEFDPIPPILQSDFLSFWVAHSALQGKAAKVRKILNFEFRSLT